MNIQFPLWKESQSEQAQDGNKTKETEEFLKKKRKFLFFRPE